VNVPQACTDLYYLAYPLGFVVSFLTHWALNAAFPAPGLGAVDAEDYYGTFTEHEAVNLGVDPNEGLDGVDAAQTVWRGEGTGEPRITSKV